MMEFLVDDACCLLLLLLFLLAPPLVLKDTCDVKVVEGGW